MQIGGKNMYQPEQPIFDEQPESNIEVTIGIEDVPKPWWKSWYFALQITLVDFTPFMWVSGFASLAGIQSASFTATTMLSACFFCMGICTFLQTTIGNRLPIVQGTSSSLMSSMGSIAGVYGLPATWGSILVGGFLEFLLGATRVISKIRKFLPPVVLGSVVTSIGFVAARIAVQWTFSNTEPVYMILAVIAFILALLLKFLGRGIVSQGFILISVVLVGVVGASALGLFDWKAVQEAPWFALPPCLSCFPSGICQIRPGSPASWSRLSEPQSSAASLDTSARSLSQSATMAPLAPPVRRSIGSSTSTGVLWPRAWAV